MANAIEIAAPVEQPFYSVVIPLYDEADVLAELHARLCAVMDSLAAPYEVIFVNDGSHDSTQDRLERIADRDPRVTVLELRRNFGQTAAMAAGFDHAEGEVVISMDGDLQHAPEDIPLLLAPLADGYDLVSGWRKRRVDSFLLRRFPSMVANRIMRLLSGVEIHDFGTTFKVYRRDLLHHIKLYGELHRFIPALASAVGARICEVPIQNVERSTGHSHYGLGRTLRVLMDLVTVKFLIQYSTRPLHFLGLPGLLTLGLGFGTGVYLLCEKIVKGWGRFHLLQQRGPLLGAALLLVVIGTLFIITGLLGELVVRTYFESQDKRIYYVRSIHRHGLAP